PLDAMPPGAAVALDGAPRSPSSAARLDAWPGSIQTTGAPTPSSLPRSGLRLRAAGRSSALAAERHDMLIGYARVSTDDQKLDLQRDAFAKAGIDQQDIYSDEMSAVGKKRPGLELALK